MASEDVVEAVASEDGSKRVVKEADTRTVNWFDTHSSRVRWIRTVIIEVLAGKRWVFDTQVVDTRKKLFDLIAVYSGFVSVSVSVGVPAALKPTAAG